MHVNFKYHTFTKIITMTKDLKQIRLYKNYAIVFAFVLEPRDFWIGLFWDSSKKFLYILPLPMIGFIIKFKKLNDAPTASNN